MAFNSHLTPLFSMHLIRYFGGVGWRQAMVILADMHARPLYAPVRGRMDRTIHESASCKAYYKFSCKDECLCEFTGDQASFEFEYS